MSADGELRAVIDRIEATFGRDIDGWLACFDMPMVMVTPQGTLVIDDPAAARDQFQPMFDALETQGFASTAADQVEVRVLGDDVALIDAQFTRRRADGSVLEQLGALYVCRLKSGGWRVAVLVRHPYGADALNG